MASSAQCTSSRTRIVGASAQLAHERAGDLVGPGARRHQFLQSAGRLLDDVDEWPEGTRREQSVAGPQRTEGDSLYSLQNRRTSVVFPTPTSPPLKTSRP